jgi:hypothetical protein
LNLHPELDLLKEISDNTKQAAESSAEILKLLSAIREE